MEVLRFLLAVACILGIYAAASSGVRRVDNPRQICQHLGGVIDTHVHLTNRTTGIRYVLGTNQWGGDHTYADYRLASAASPIGTPERVVFIEVAVDPLYAHEEAKWVQQLADAQAAEEPKHGQRPSSIAAVVAYLPLEEGRAKLERLVARMKTDVRLFVGVRRMLFARPWSGNMVSSSGYLQSQIDLNATDNCWFVHGTAGDAFVEGLHVLAENNLHFELLTSDHSSPLQHGEQYDCALELVRRAPPELVIVADHVGDMRAMDVPNNWAAWKQYVSALAARPKTYIKLGGVPERSTHGTQDSWRESEAFPYIRHAVEAFGYDRCMYESNWFVVDTFASFASWTRALLGMLDALGATDDQLHQVFCGTASQVYLREKDLVRERIKERQGNADRGNY